MPTSRHTPIASLLASLLTRSVRRSLNVTLLCALGSGVLPTFAGAQQTKSIPLLSELPLIRQLFLRQQALPGDAPARSLPINIEAKGVTLGALVDLLMDQAHVSYTLDANLAALPAGNVKLRKVPFRIALETVLKMSHGRATYRLENGIYRIVEREDGEVEGADNAPKTTKQAGKLDGSDPIVTPDGAARTNAGDAGETLLNIQANNSTLAAVLKQLAAQAKIAIVLDPSLHDVPVTAYLNNIPLRAALGRLLNALVKPATYRVENGVYIIIAKADESPEGTIPPDLAAVSAAPITLDAEKTDLYSVLKQVFAQVKANYTLDPALHDIPITAHFHELPLHNVLDVLLKGTGKPLTYRVKDGIFSIVPKM